ncbi:MAG: nucleotide exchange factor GrpE [Clostridia bacterium]
MGKKTEEEIKECVEDVLDENNMEDLEDINKDDYIAKLNDDLKEQQKKADEYYDHLRRNVAEFDNFKKRINKEKDNMYFSITSDIISELLPIMDNFEKAMLSKTKDESFKSGMEMIYNQLHELLGKLGIEEIETNGVVFDPNLHEAVMYIEDKKHSEKEIVEVFRKGYKIGDKVIRHSMVKVAN